MTEIYNLSLTQEGNEKPNVNFNYDQENMSLHQAAYLNLDVAIDMLTYSIQKEGRRPTQNEIAAIVLQLIREKTEPSN